MNRFKHWPGLTPAMKDRIEKLGNEHPDEIIYFGADMVYQTWQDAGTLLVGIGLVLKAYMFVSHTIAAKLGF